MDFHIRDSCERTSVLGAFTGGKLPPKELMNRVGSETFIEERG